MTELSSSAQSEAATAYDYELVVAALRKLPDRCASNVDDLANRIGANKLTLIGWVRDDLQFARLVGLKVGQ